MTDTNAVERLQTEAPIWFALLRDRICAAFETLEDEVDGARSPRRRPSRAASNARRGSAGTMAALPAAAASCR